MRKDGRAGMKKTKVIACVVIALVVIICGVAIYRAMDSPDTQLARDAFDAEEGEYDETIENYSKLIDDDPNSADAYVNRGDAYADKGEYDKAIADFSKVVELDPGNEDAIEQLKNVKGLIGE
jgi:tetratricopeptide (TPR) repeat protein